MRKTYAGNGMHHFSPLARFEERVIRCQTEATTKPIFLNASPVVFLEETLRQDFQLGKVPLVPQYCSARFLLDHGVLKLNRLHSKQNSIRIGGRLSSSRQTAPKCSIFSHSNSAHLNQFGVSRIMPNNIACAKMY